MKYQGEVAQLLESIRNRVQLLNGGIMDNRFTKIDISNSISNILRELETAQGRVDLNEETFGR